MDVDYNEMLNEYIEDGYVKSEKDIAALKDFIIFIEEVKQPAQDVVFEYIEDEDREFMNERVAIIVEDFVDFVTSMGG